MSYNELVKPPYLDIGFRKLGIYVITLVIEHSSKNILNIKDRFCSWSIWAPERAAVGLLCLGE